MATLLLARRSSSGATHIEILLRGEADPANFIADTAELNLTTAVHLVCKGASQKIPRACLVEDPSGSGEFRLKSFADLPEEANFMWEMEISAGTDGAFRLGNMDVQIPAVAGRAKTWGRLRLCRDMSKYSAENPFLEIYGFAWFRAAKDGPAFERLLRAGFVIEKPGDLLPDQITLPKFRFRLPNLGFSLPFDIDLNLPSINLPNFGFPLQIPAFDFMLPRLPFRLEVAGFRANFEGLVQGGQVVSGTALFEAASIAVFSTGGGMAITTIQQPKLELALKDGGVTVTGAGTNRIEIPDHVLRIPETGAPLLSLAWRGATLGNSLNQNVLTTTLHIPQFVLESSVVGGEVAQGEIKLLWVDGKLDPAQSFVSIDLRSLGRRLTLKLEDLTQRVVRELKDEFRELVLEWRQSEVARLLRQISEEIVEAGEQLAEAAGQGAQAGQELLEKVDEFVRLSTAWKNGRLTQIRLDWRRHAPSPKPVVRRFHLPGVVLELPGDPCADFSYSVLLDELDGDSALYFMQTICAGQESRLYPSFALGGAGGPEGEAGRYLGEEDRAEPFLTITAKPKQRKSVVFFKQHFNGAGPRRQFFRQLVTSLPDQIAAVPRKARIDTATEGLKIADWDIDADFSESFLLPFLKAREDLENAGSAVQSFLAQYIEIGNFRKKIELPKIACTADLRVILGNMRVAGNVELGFDLETFAFKIDPGKRLVLEDTSQKIEQEFLPGLRFEFEGVEVPGTTPKKFSFLELHMERGNFQLRQVAGSKIRLCVTTISAEPLEFVVENFAVTGSGIDLDARVDPQKPIRLNGVDTEFRFSEGKLSVRQGRVVDFTLKGEGSLPPDLVGDAEVTAWIRMGERGGSFKVLEAGAELKINKPLKCEGTKFKTSLSGLGLRFAGEPHAHFYFTLTGTAEFDPGAIPDSNPLAFLPGIKLELLECPLTRDWSLLKKHVKFTVTLPTKKKFRFLGCFEFELRGIGFIPAADCFGGDPAISITGQIKFALSGGDVIDARFDFHEMFLGLPKGGSIFPRVSAKGLGLSVSTGSAFKLSGSLDFFDEEKFDETGIEAKGFAGTGTLLISGLPEISANFAFLRIRRPENGDLVKAWFVFIEARKFSLQMASLPLYLREVGLGFGYRFTLASIKQADLIDDVKALLAELKRLSRSQGELSDRKAWLIDLESPGQTPRWTVVLRAMFSFSSAAGSPLDWNEDKEKTLPNLALFDVVMALRSDLTFLMTLRGWLFTNYYSFVKEAKPGLRENPLVSGFMLLSPRKRLFLAHMSSNENAVFGGNPPLWDILEKAITMTRFSATFLAKPGLVHMELGWPNNLRYAYTMGGVLEVSISAGLLQRVETRRYVSGLSLMARGRLDIEAGLSLGFFGVRVFARADVAFGARVITIIGLRNPLKDSALYMGIGLSIDAQFGVEAWLRIKIGFCKITLRFGFSFRLSFTALVEVGMEGIDVPGLRARGTLALKVLGRSLRIGVDVGFRKAELERARNVTADVLNLGLEASDPVGDLPGSGESASKSAGNGGPENSPLADAVQPLMENAAGDPVARPANAPIVRVADPKLDAIDAPDYSILRREGRDASSGAEKNYVYFMLMPRGERARTPTEENKGKWEEETGFLPPPPAIKFKDDGSEEPTPAGQIDFDIDFKLENPQAPAFKIEQFARAADGAYDWRVVGKEEGGSTTHGVGKWSVHWDAKLSDEAQSFHVRPDQEPQPTGEQPPPMTLKRYAANAFMCQYTDAQGNVYPPDAPDTPEEQAGIEPVEIVAKIEPFLPPIAAGKGVRDSRVQNPSDTAYEAALLTALNQVRRSPHFRYDPTSEYDRLLREAFRNDSSTLHLPTNEEGQPVAEPAWKHRNENALHTRGVIVQQMVSQFEEYVDAQDKAGRHQIDAHAIPPLPFAFGVVFRIEVPKDFKPAEDVSLPLWLRQAVLQAGDARPRLKQRKTAVAMEPDSSLKELLPFAARELGFKKIAPIFRHTRALSDAGTIGISWELDWDLSGLDAATRDGLTDAQRDIEHHLAYYEVTRISLSGREAPVSFRLKSAEALAPERNWATQDPNKRIQSRCLAAKYQLTDYFHGDDPGALAKLPPSGITYFYTITPVDRFNQRGASRTVEVTRKPEVLPEAVTEAEFVVSYDFARVIEEQGKPDRKELELKRFDPQQGLNADRKLLGIRPVPDDAKKNPGVYVDFPRPPDFRPEGYRLIFRKERTLALGSYGFDAGTEDRTAARNPSSTTRRAPTDIVLAVGSDDEENPRHPQPANRSPGQWVRIFVPLDDLKAAGVYPKDDLWRPEAWSVFLQAAFGDEESSLTPARIKLSFAWHKPLADAPEVDQAGRDTRVRRPAFLEWLPLNFISELHPERDLQQQIGGAFVPMPVEAGQYGVSISAQDGKVPGVDFKPHPKRPRLVRFRWNPNHHDKAKYPTALNAGFTLHELDLDSISSRILGLLKSTDPKELEKYRDALWPRTRLLQNIQLVPADEAPLVPHSTINTNEWEAWYASRVLRDTALPPNPEERKKFQETAWNDAWWSWRESYLLWPEWSLVRKENGQDKLLFSLAPRPAPLTVTGEIPKWPHETDGLKIDSLSLRIIPDPNFDPNSELLVWTGGSIPANEIASIDYAPEEGGLQIAFKTPQTPSDTAKIYHEIAEKAVAYLRISPQRTNSLTLKVSVTVNATVTVGGTPQSRSDPRELTFTTFVEPMERYFEQAAATTPPDPIDAYHPFLRELITFLEQDPASEEPKQKYSCELQGLPQARVDKWEDFIADSPPGTDAYGWGVLQRLGLSATFTLRDRVTGEPETRAATEEQLRRALEALSKQTTTATTTDWKAILPHVHVEFLVQRAYATEVRDLDQFGVEGLLAIVQVSLRPRPRRLFQYQRALLTAPPGQNVTLLVEFPDGTKCEAIEAASPNGQRKTLEARLLKTGGKTGALLEVTPGADGRSHPVFRSLAGVTNVSVLVPDERVHHKLLSSDLQSRFEEIEFREAVPGEIAKWRRLKLNGGFSLEEQRVIRAAVTMRHVSVGKGHTLPGGGEVAFRIKFFGALPLEKDAEGKLVERPLVLSYELKTQYGTAAETSRTIEKTIEANAPASGLRVATAPSKNDVGDELKSATITLKSPEESGLKEIPWKFVIKRVEQNEVEQKTATWLSSDLPVDDIEAPPPPDDIAFEPFLFLARAPVRLDFDAKPLESPGLDSGFAPVGRQPFDDSPFDVFRNYEDWATHFGVESATPADDSPQKHWLRFKAMVESLRPFDPAAPSKQLLPVDPKGIERIVDNFLAWTARFHDHRGASDAEGKGGPWLATAYPRVGAPAFAVTENDGRLRYDHFLDDRWAHARRYFLWPYSRYDLFWLGLAEEEPEAEKLMRLHPERRPATISKVNGNGQEATHGFDQDGFLRRHVDARITRIEALDAPLILSSRRLDPPATTKEPLPLPSPTWEVILAQHPEQTLSDHNSTLRRRLSFRRMAWTLLRRPLYVNWIAQAKELMLEPKSDVVFPEQTPKLPALPDKVQGPIRLDPEEITPKQEQLAISTRLVQFHEGALVIQWEGQPFCYAHRFIAGAVASRVASPLAEVLQKDFEFIAPSSPDKQDPKDAAFPTPALAAQLDGLAIGPADAAEEILHLVFEVAAFWDCLPQPARQRWPAENPANPAFGALAQNGQPARRLYASLPDPDVAYEFILARGGDVVRQDEFFFKVSPRTPGESARDERNNEPLGWQPALAGGGRRILFANPKAELVADAKPTRRFDFHADGQPVLSIPLPDPSPDIVVPGADPVSSSVKIRALHLRGSLDLVALHKRIRLSSWEVSELGTEAEITIDTVFGKTDPVSRFHPAIAISAPLPDQFAGKGVLDTERLFLIRQGVLSTGDTDFLKIIKTLAPNYGELQTKVDELLAQPDDNVTVRRSLRWMPVFRHRSAEDRHHFEHDGQILRWNPQPPSAALKVGDYVKEWELATPKGPFPTAANALLAPRIFANPTIVSMADALNAHFGLNLQKDHFEARPSGPGVQFAYSALHQPGLTIDELRDLTDSIAEVADQPRLKQIWNDLQNYLANVLPNQSQPLAPVPFKRECNAHLVVGTTVLHGDPAVTGEEAALAAAQGEINAIYDKAPKEEAALDRTALARLRTHADFRQQLENAFGAAELVSIKPDLETEPWRPRVVVNELKDTSGAKTTMFRWLGFKPTTEEIEKLGDLAGTKVDFKLAVAALERETKEWDHANVRSFEYAITSDQPEIPTTLASSLHFCTHEIRYAGIMGAQRKEELAAKFTSPADQRAVRRMHRATVRQALQGYEALLKTRRGGAEPGTIPIALPELPEVQKKP